MKSLLLSLVLVMLVLVSCSEQAQEQEKTEEVVEPEEETAQGITSFREAYKLALQDPRCENIYSPDNTPGPGTGQTDEFLEEVFWNQQGQTYSFPVEDGDSCLGNNLCLVTKSGIVTHFTTDEACPE